MEAHGQLTSNETLRKHTAPAGPADEMRGRPLAGDSSLDDL